MFKALENIEKTNEELKEKYNSTMSVKNTLQNDLLALQGLLDQEKSANSALNERLNETECKLVQL